MSDLLRIVFRDRRWPLRGESGHRLLFRPSEQPSLLKGIKRFEPDVREEWKVLLAPGDVIFDVGANIGLTVDRFWGLLGGACTIWAFEPLPRNLELLRPNARQLSTTSVSGWITTVDWSRSPSKDPEPSSIPRHPMVLPGGTASAEKRYPISRCGFEVAPVGDPFTE